MLIKRSFVTAALCVGISERVVAQTPADSAAIRATALDYIEGWYAGDAARMERALHPELVKRIVNKNQWGRSELSTMGALTLIQKVRNGGGKDDTPKRSDVRILDIYQNAAVARVDAASWIDYLQLGRWNGKWVIVNVLWENMPKP